MAISLGPSGLQLNDGTHNDFADFAGGGKIVQCQQSTFSNQNTQTTSTSFQATWMQSNITPSATSSKILVMGTGQWMIDAYSNQGINAELAIYRTGSLVNRMGHTSWTDSAGAGYSFVYLDSPSTTSSRNYRIYIRNVSTYGGSRLTGWRCNSSSSTVGNLILMEVTF